MGQEKEDYLEQGGKKGKQKSLLPLALEMIPKELTEGHRVWHIIHFEPPFH